MIQNTSLSVYRRLQQQGVIKKIGLEIVAWMEAHQDDEFYGGMLSQSDVVRALEADTNRTESSVRPTMTHLSQCGVITCVGSKKDIHGSGNMVMGYRLSGELAKPLPKLRPYKQLLKDCLPFLPPGELADEVRARLGIEPEQLNVAA